MNNVWCSRNQFHSLLIKIFIIYIYIYLRDIKDKWIDSEVNTWSIDWHPPRNLYPQSLLLKMIERKKSQHGLKGNDKHKSFHWLKTHRSDWQNVNQYTVKTPVSKHTLKVYFSRITWMYAHFLCQVSSLPSI